MRDEGVRRSERVVGGRGPDSRSHALRRSQPAQQEGLLLQDIRQAGGCAENLSIGEFFKLLKRQLKSVSNGLKLTFSTLKTFESVIFFNLLVKKNSNDLKLIFGVHLF